MAPKIKILATSDFSCRPGYEPLDFSRKHPERDRPGQSFDCRQLIGQIVGIEVDGRAECGKEEKTSPTQTQSLPEADATIERGAVRC